MQFKTHCFQATGGHFDTSLEL